MANDESKRTGDSAKPPPQVASPVPARKPASTAPERNRGDTLAKRASGPRELPPQLGRYRIIKKLGGGGMGTVYLVENTELEREEALKVPHFGEGDDPQLRERFLREAKSAAKLDHANLCPVYDAGVQDGFYYLTMRFLKGKLLSDYTGTAQPARKAVEIVTKLAQALEAAHAKGVIHRDLKPSNVMMVGGVGPVVMDFGLAKQVRQEHTKLTQDGSMLGTPAYMPPEQVNGDLERMGPASDVYSLGVILYELLTGRLPFEGTMAMIFGQILYTEPPLPSALVSGLSPALDGICRKAMAKTSAERYPSMKAFAWALMDFLRSTSATAGAGSEAPTAADKAAIFQIPTAAPGPLPAGKSGISQTPMAAPGPLAAATVPPRAPTASVAPKPMLRERSAEGRERVPVKAARKKKHTKSNRALAVGMGAGLLGASLAVTVVTGIVLFWRPSSGTALRGSSAQEASPADAVIPSPAPAQTRTRTRPVPRAAVANQVRPPGSRRAISTTNTDGFPWTVEGDQLINEGPEGATISFGGQLDFFGQRRWSDYDLDFEVLKSAGSGGVGAAFRCGGEGFYSLELGSLADTHILGLLSSKIHEKVYTKTIQSSPGTITPNQWYKVKISLRGQNIRIELDDGLLFDCKDDFIQNGNVQLRFYKSGGRFRNIKVTAADGTVLWEGPPEMLR